MRIRISHEMAHRYAPGARMLIQNLRLTPHGFDSQYVLRWRIEVDANSALRQSEDAHGNIVTTFSHYGAPIERLTVSAAGEIETTDAAGVVRGAVERLPAEMYLRDSPLAHVNGALRDLANEATAGASDPLDAMHRLMSEVNSSMSYDPHQADDPEIGGRGLRAETRPGARLRPYLHRLRPLPRHSGALHRRLPRRRRGRRRAGGALLGRGACAATGLGGLRPDRLYLRRRPLCPRGRRLRHPGRLLCAHCAWDRRGRGRDRDQGRAGGSSGAGVKGDVSSAGASNRTATEKAAAIAPAQQLQKWATTRVSNVRNSRSSLSKRRIGGAPLNGPPRTDRRRN